MASTLVHSQSPEPPASNSDNKGSRQSKRGRYDDDEMGDMESSPSPQAKGCTHMANTNSSENGFGGVSFTSGIPVGMNMSTPFSSEPIIARSLSDRQVNETVLKKARFGELGGTDFTQDQRAFSSSAPYASAALSSSSSSSSLSSAAHGEHTDTGPRISGAMCSSSPDGAGAGTDRIQSHQRAGSGIGFRSASLGIEEADREILEFSPSASFEGLNMWRVDSIGEYMHVNENDENGNMDPGIQNRNTDAARKRPKMHQFGEYERNDGEYNRRWGYTGDGDGDGHSRQSGTANTTNSAHAHAHAHASAVAGPPTAKYVEFLREAYTSTHQLLLTTKQESAQYQCSSKLLLDKLSANTISLEVCI